MGISAFKSTLHAEFPIGLVEGKAYDREMQDRGSSRVAHSRCALIPLLCFIAASVAPAQDNPVKIIADCLLNISAGNGSGQLVPFSEAQPRLPLIVRLLHVTGDSE
jgi:hypothetical protein